MKQQYGESRLPAACGQHIAHLHHLQRNGCARQGQPQARHQRHAPLQPQTDAHRRKQHRAAQHLRATPAKDGAAQAPQALGLQLQPHQKQHQHYAKLGKVQYVLHIGHQSQAPGANGNARGQVANDGA